jgi:hypothetical protein
MTINEMVSRWGANKEIYKVVYRNEGRRQETPGMSLKGARESLDFLKFQGAKRATIKHISER